MGETNAGILPLRDAQGQNDNFGESAVGSPSPRDLAGKLFGIYGLGNVYCGKIFKTLLLAAK
jgi:hypothetical protein